MDGITLIGLAGAACTTCSYFPQVRQSWRTKETKDISLGMYSLLTVGVAVWLVYGILKRDIALMASNSISLISSASILYLKLKYGSP